MPPPEREFIAALLAKIHKAETVGSQAQKLEFRPTTVFAVVPLAAEIKSVAAVEREHSIKHW